MTDKQKTERITVDLKGLRKRLERLSTEPGQSIGSIIRMVLVKGLEVLESQPTQEFRQNLRLPSIADQIKQFYVSSELSRRSGISQERLVDLANGAEPELHELSLLEPVLGVTLEQLYEVYQNDFPCSNKIKRAHTNGAL